MRAATTLRVQSIRMRALRVDGDPGWCNHTQLFAIDSKSIAVKPPGMRIDVSLRHVTPLTPCRKRVCVAHRIPLAAYGEGRTLNESHSPFPWTDAPVTGRSAGLRGNGGAICLRVTLPLHFSRDFEDRDITASLPTTPTHFSLMLSAFWHRSSHSALDFSLQRRSCSSEKELVPWPTCLRRCR